MNAKVHPDQIASYRTFLLDMFNRLGIHFIEAKLTEAGHNLVKKIARNKVKVML